MPIRLREALGDRRQAARRTMRSVLVVLALWDAGAAADLAALAPLAPEEHAPAVERSAARAAKASRLLADHGHLLPPDLREKGQDLLNEHEFRVRAALDSSAGVETSCSMLLSSGLKASTVGARSSASMAPGDADAMSVRNATRSSSEQPRHAVCQPIQLLQCCQWP